MYVDLSDASRRRGGSQALRAYVATPAGEGPWPAVVVVHEAFGLDVNAESAADRVAAMGYLAVAPDLYSDGGAQRCLISTFRDFLRQSGRSFTDLETARLWALAQPHCSGRAGILGLCMGGGFALLTADRADYEVASVNYGRLPADDWQAYESRCPIVGSYGGRDRSLRGAAFKLSERLTEAGVEHDVVEYADAGHAFLNKVPTGPRLLLPLMRIDHVGPEPASAADAWRRIEAFFALHLGGPKTPAA